MQINESSRYIPVRQTEQPAAYRQKNMASGTAASADPTAPQDVVIISAENKQESLKNQQYAANIEMDEMNLLPGSTNAQADEESDAEVQRKCMVIAARIIAGDEVPQRDYRYLAKNNLELYCKAICMRVVRKKPRRHKPVSDDESTKNQPDFAATTVGNEDMGLVDTGAILDLPTAETSSG